MTDAQKFLLTLQVIFSIAIMSFLAYQLFKARREKHKYRLYSVRDRLLYLLATHEIKEESVLFQVLYGIINYSIMEVKQLTIWSFAKASVKAKLKLESQANDEFWTEVEKASPKVHEVVNEFFRSMMYIAMANSFFFVLLIRLMNHSQRLMSGISSFLRVTRLFSDKRQRYDAYRYFENRFGGKGDFANSH
jgi:hypothetical protein